MEDQNDILDRFFATLAREIALAPTPEPVTPLPVDYWIAMSALQKSIRRGQVGLARAAAARLLSAGNYLVWHHLVGISFQDIGLADIDTVGLAVAACGGRRVRNALGGDLKVLSYLCARMCSSKKSRASDDLRMLIERLPSLEQRRSMFLRTPNTELRSIVASQQSLPVRGLALWCLCGANSYSSKKYVAPRRGYPSQVFRLLSELETSPTILALARTAHYGGAHTVAPLTALISTEADLTEPLYADDTLPPEIVVDGIPSWIMDRFSPTGRLALSMFLDETSETGVFLKRHVPPLRRWDILEDGLFHIEEARLINRCKLPLFEDLRRLNEEDCIPVDREFLYEFLGTLKNDLPILSQIRANLIKATLDGRIPSSY